MIVRPAPFPALGFDTVTPMDAVRAQGLKDAGMVFAIRYLGSLSATEVAIILGAGLGLMPVTYSRRPGWSPTAQMGAEDGALDVQHLAAAGLPQGCTVWIDLEGVDPTATPADTAGWVNARAAVIRAAGYDVGLYVGSSDILNAQQLFALAQIDRYWKSLSDVPTPTCGFALIQLYKTITLAGTTIDVDCVQYDYKDRLPLMVFE